MVKSSTFYRLIFLCDGFTAAFSGTRFDQKAAPFDFTDKEMAVTLAENLTDHVLNAFPRRTSRRIVVRQIETTHGYANISAVLTVFIPDDKDPPRNSFEELFNNDMA